MPFRQPRTDAIAPISIAQEDDVELEVALLHKRWTWHVVSHPFSFHRRHLAEYANELVAFLRVQAIRTFGYEVGYGVELLHTSAFVVFDVTETRDLDAEPQQQQPPPQPRHASMLLYVPEHAQDDALVERLGRESLIAATTTATMTATSTSTSPPPAPGDPARASSEPLYALLLHGDVGLLVWMCAWVQHRFQCVVGKHVVHVTTDNLRSMAREWVQRRLIEELGTRQVEVENENENEDDNGTHAEVPGVKPKPKAPVLLLFHTPQAAGNITSFTITIPWATLERVYRKSNPDDVLQMAEKQYFANIPAEMGALELAGIEMEEVAIDTNGTVQFLRMAMVPVIFQSLLHIQAIQNIPGPAEPQRTF